MSWTQAIILEKDEKVISSWKGNREVIYHKGAFSEESVRKNGFLVLTSQRLLFLEEHGFVGKSYHQVLAMSLMSIGGVSMGGTFSRFVSIAENAGDNVQTHIFHLVGVGKEEFEPVRSLIIETRNKRREEIEQEKRKERVHLVLDFSSLKDYMAKGGLILQTMKCPECGAPVALPSAGSQMKCGHW